MCNWSSWTVSWWPFASDVDGSADIAGEVVATAATETGATTGAIATDSVGPGLFLFLAASLANFLASRSAKTASRLFSSPADAADGATTVGTATATTCAALSPSRLRPASTTLCLAASLATRLASRSASTCSLLSCGGPGIGGMLLMTVLVVLVCVGVVGGVDGGFNAATDSVATVVGAVSALSDAFVLLRLALLCGWRLLGKVAALKLAV